MTERDVDGRARPVVRSISADGSNRHSRISMSNSVRCTEGNGSAGGFDRRSRSPPSGEMDSSPLQFLMLASSVLCALFAFWQQKRVVELQEKMNAVSRVCNVSGAGQDEIFGSTNNKVTALSFSGAVLLATTIGLHTFFNRFLRINELSKRWRSDGDRVPLVKLIAYRVDIFFSTRPYGKLLLLLAATVFLIAFGALALYAVRNDNIFDALWIAWTFVADTGSHTEQVGFMARIVAVVITAGGMLVFATMLGLVSDLISDKVDSLRKGKSEVIETDHILILGWSNKLGCLLKQLANANKSNSDVVVVLAERDKEEMETEIGNLEFDFMGTSVICRSGSPLILADLKKVSFSKARAIIVLADDGNAEQSDARALRIVLTLTGIKERLRGHIVAEICDLDNEPLLKLVGGDVTEIVVAHDVIGRMMIQSALQPGLAQVWESILGFENSEFYVKRWPQLDGMQFKDVLFSFPDAVPCGIKVSSMGGKIVINPSDDYVLEEGDEIVVIAEDVNNYAPGPLAEVNSSFVLPRVTNTFNHREKVLFCGWRRDIHDMIQAFHDFLVEDSEVWMFNDVPLEERMKRFAEEDLDLSTLCKIKFVHVEGNAVNRHHLKRLPLETFDAILILADASVEDSIVQCDSHSLATLLLIRDIQTERLPPEEKKSQCHAFPNNAWIHMMQPASEKSVIISEILDSRTRNLVSVSAISDYVLSNQLVSMALAMVAEDKQINGILQELFSGKSNEFGIRSAECYLGRQEEASFYEELSFYDIMIRARHRGEILIGYRLADGDEVTINPRNKFEKRMWSSGDAFIVIWQSK